MKGVIDMIDRNQMRDCMNLTRRVLMQRIIKLTKIAELLDQIELNMSNFNDDQLGWYVAQQDTLRVVFAKQEDEWDAEERELWKQLLSMTVPGKEEES